MTDQNEQNQGANISIEQVCAAMLNKFGKVELQIQDVLKDYSGKSIAVNQDIETQALIFELVDVVTEDQAKSE
jgi:hypothetical protein